MLGTLSAPATAQGVRGPFGPIFGTPGGGGTVQPVQPINANPAGGGTSSVPLRVSFTGLFCHDESNDNTFPNPDHDEMYVVIFRADLRNGGARGRVTVSQEFGDVDTGESRSDNLALWDLNGNGSPMGSNDYIFLAALMECDDSANIGALRRKVSSVLLPKLASYKAAGMSRLQMIGNLRIDMDLAIDSAKAGDDRVGGITEVFFTDFQLARARTGIASNEFREFTGSDSRYRLTFRLQ
jgi:hypothetical protein